ncbi:S-layer homology domain-containing protein [Lysinibacillus fusiformis]|nr:S-layer homology domain-containing protein [Lysinibacillus fusiformis]
MANQPKKYKKFVATAATATLVASAIVPVAASAATPKFPDVGSDYADAVNAIADLGIVKGYTDGTFKPLNTVDRAGVVKFLGKFLVAQGKTLPSYEAATSKGFPFSDLTASSDKELVQYAALVKAEGVFTGYTDGTLNPTQAMPRHQMASVLVKAIKVIYGIDLIAEAKTANFVSDITDIKGNVYEEAIAALDFAGLTVATKYDPSRTLNRGQFANFLSRSIDFVAEFEANKEAQVVSVSAINAKKVEVKFNKEVNKVTAETPATYSLVGLVGGTTWTPVLQEDGKTVVLTLNNAIANDTTFVAIVNEVATKADSTVKTEKFTKTITFSDTAKPTFTGVTYPEAGSAVLNFSEDLSTKGTPAVYDGNVDVTSSLSVTHAANSNQVSIAGLTVDKEYRVVVVGAKDQSNNLIASPIEVVVKSTVSEQVKPTITSVESQDLTSLKVKFSEKLKQILPGVYANVTINGATVSGATQTFDDKTNTLTITKAGLATSGVHSVSISGYKDLSNNSGDTLTKAVAFGVSAPVLEKTEVVSDSTDTYVVLTFNEAPNLTAVQAQDITGTYTTPENILKTFGSAALDETTDISVVGNTMKIKVTGKEAGKYKLSIPAAGISDGTTTRTSAQTVEFTIASSSDTAKPSVSNVFIPGENATAIGGPASVERNTVYVKYSKSMSSTAVNPDNYSVDGQKVFESAVFVGDKSVVKLTLKEGSLTLSGDRGFQISTAVTGENNVAIGSYSSTEPFKENVKPLLSSAIIIDGDTIELTFTEAIEDTNLLAAASAGNDFEVYVDGVKNVITSVVTGATSNDNKLQVNLTSALNATQLANSTITVKVLDTTDGEDNNDNPLTDGTVITVVK